MQELLETEAEGVGKLEDEGEAGEGILTCST